MTAQLVIEGLDLALQIVRAALRMYDRYADQHDARTSARMVELVQQLRAAAHQLGELQQRQRAEVDAAVSKPKVGR